MQEPDKPDAIDEPVINRNVSQARVVDPSDAVTGLGFIFGLIGAAIGIVAVLITAPSIGALVLAYCLIGALAGGSAGIVIGGMIGAIFAVLRGVTTRRTQ